MAGDMGVGQLVERFRPLFSRRVGAPVLVPLADAELFLAGGADPREVRSSIAALLGAGPSPDAVLAAIDRKGLQGSPLALGLLAALIRHGRRIDELAVRTGDDYDWDQHLQDPEYRDAARALGPFDFALYAMMAERAGRPELVHRSEPLPPRTRELLRAWIAARIEDRAADLRATFEDAEAGRSFARIAGVVAETEDLWARMAGHAEARGERRSVEALRLGHGAYEFLARVLAAGMSAMSRPDDRTAPPAATLAAAKGVDRLRESPHRPGNDYMPSVANALRPLGPPLIRQLGLLMSRGGEAVPPADAVEAAAAALRLAGHGEAGRELEDRWRRLTGA
jgi:hypothetical protein